MSETPSHIRVTHWPVPGVQRVECGAKSDWGKIYGEGKEKRGRGEGEGEEVPLPSLPTPPPFPLLLSSLSSRCPDPQSERLEQAS